MELAAYVVCGSNCIAERRPAKDVFVADDPDKVCQIGTAGREL
jgi:hypothetical protein